jgi:hypothetical protein
MKNKIVLSDAERAILEGLNHPVYDADFLEKWINRNDSLFINAPAALQACFAKGFYEAVKALSAAGYRVLPEELVGKYCLRRIKGEQEASV